MLLLSSLGLFGHLLLLLLGCALLLRCRHLLHLRLEERAHHLPEEVPDVGLLCGRCGLGRLARPEPGDHLSGDRSLGGSCCSGGGGWGLPLLLLAL